MLVAGTIKTNCIIPHKGRNICNPSTYDAKPNVRNGSPSFSAPPLRARLIFSRAFHLHFYQGCVLLSLSGNTRGWATPTLKRGGRTPTSGQGCVVIYTCLHVWVRLETGLVVLHPSPPRRCRFHLHPGGCYVPYTHSYLHNRTSIRFRIRSEFSPLSNSRGICFCEALSIYLCFDACQVVFIYELFSVSWILRCSMINIVFITNADLLNDYLPC